jgi:hypothetical protein
MMNIPSYSLMEYDGQCNTNKSDDLHYVLPTCVTKGSRHTLPRVFVERPRSIAVDLTK